MNTLRHAILAFCCCVNVVYAADSTAKCASLNEFQWLLATWSTSASLPATFEQWRQVSLHTFEGRGWRETTEGIRFEETLRIVQMADNIFLLAKVPENPLPIAFKAAHCDKASVIFENKHHDFPTRLHYQFGADNSGSGLTVKVSGADGKGFTLQFGKILQDQY